MMERDRNTPVEVLMVIPFSESEVQALRDVSPRLRVTVLPVHEVREIPNEVWARTEVLYTDRVLPTPEQVPALRWIQCHFAGIDFAIDLPIVKKPDIAITTLSGVAAPQMAEYALTMLLGFGRRLPEIAACQIRAEWPRDRWERFRPVDLRGSTVGIVGYGSIGREIARLLNAFGASVLAVKRDVMHPEDTGYFIPGLGDPGGDLFTRLYPYQALKSMLKECDFVVVVLPLTPETRGLIGAAELGVMKSTAYLISMARGGIIDQASLLAALQEKRIAGAALDAFVEEPLPANHPLWRLPNVIISPHIGGMSVHYNRRAVDLFVENLKRYLAESPLLNRFDLNKGY
jgi:phosphoglycerate dehydrogenase-like enzyme